MNVICVYKLPIPTYIRRPTYSRVRREKLLLGITLYNTLTSEIQGTVCAIFSSIWLKLGLCPCVLYCHCHEYRYDSALHCAPAHIVSAIPRVQQLNLPHVLAVITTVHDVVSGAVHVYSI